MQDSHRRARIDARQIRFGNIDELNARVGERCMQPWTEVANVMRPSIKAITS